MKPAIKLNPSNPAILRGINEMRRVVGSYDISFNQAALLLALPSNEASLDDRITPSRVAEIMGITRGAVTRLCRALLDRKLIVHEKDPDDWRFVLLRRTKRGDTLLAKITLDAAVQEAKGIEAAAA